MSQTSTRKHDATNGRVYGGDTGLVHIADGRRQEVGDRIATDIDLRVRLMAADDYPAPSCAGHLDLCPGCYQVALFHALVRLARTNHQDVRELGRSMAAAFQRLADGEDVSEVESLTVYLDP